MIDHRTGMEFAEKPEPAEAGVSVEMVARGLGLLAGAVASMAALVSLRRRSRGLGGFAALPLVGAAVLFGWAAAIHLTGGERFDDHPWV